MVRMGCRIGLIIAVLFIFFSQPAGAAVNSSSTVQQFSGRSFVGVRLSSLHLENTTIRNMVLEDVIADGAYFHNIVFDNCRFSWVDLRRSFFEDVVFRNCIL